MRTLVAASSCLPLGPRPGPEPGQEPVSRAAGRVDWTSASALNALFKDKVSVKRFLNEVANGGDTSAREFIAELYEDRFVDLNGDGWFELVALVGGQRLSTALEVVFQTPGGAPPADRLATTHEGFVMRELPGFDAGDLNAVLRDLDHDGTYKIVMPQLLGGFEGAARPQATIPEVFSWNGGDYAKVSARYPSSIAMRCCLGSSASCRRSKRCRRPPTRTGPIAARSARSMLARLPKRASACRRNSRAIAGAHDAGACFPS